jgi:transposase-like protein
MTLFDFQRQFPDDTACLTYLEKQRWGDDASKRSCPNCGSAKSYSFTTRKLYKCAACRKQFTATVGTVFEGSHIPLQKWFYAAFLNTSLKKGISSIQLAKYLGITQKSAWFMLQRIRYGFEYSGDQTLLSDIVEMDEAYIGGAEKNKHASKRTPGTRGRGSMYTKTPVVGMLQRGGEVRLVRTETTDTHTIHRLVKENIDPAATVMSDSYKPYRLIEKQLGYKSLRVDHASGEYVRDDVHTNSIENTWAHLKLSIRAIYMGVSDKHMQRYCYEFAFRYNRRDMDDGQRFIEWFRHCNGRLLYRTLIGKPVKIRRPVLPMPTVWELPELSEW